MSSENRIQSLSVAPTVARQTPDNAFGTVLSRTLGEVAQKGAGILGGVATLNPAASAAVSSIHAVTSLTGAGATASVVPLVPGVQGGPVVGGTGTLGGTSNASTQDLLQQMAQGGDGSTTAYLQLQMRMQAESQQFSAVSNILKVRSDSAKAAINNIR